MSIFYSAHTNGFYDSDIHGRNIPTDCVEISKNIHSELLRGQSSGKSIKADAHGFPILIDRLIQPATIEQMLEFEDIWTVSEIDRVREELEKVQDSDPGSVGTVGAWRDYRKALRVWATHPEYPATRFRPTAPDKNKE